MRDLENKQMESKLRDYGEDKSRGVDLSREVLQVFAISSELEQNERRGMIRPKGGSDLRH